MTLRYGSVCSGIEAATVAWHVMGWQPVFFSEVAAFPSAVLAHHYGSNFPGASDAHCASAPYAGPRPASFNGVWNYGDFTRIPADAGGPAGIDVLVGGTPCQSFSMAGLRGGLSDERGNLALEFCRLAQRLRPRWVVWENVPGVLSSDGGRDFGSILGGLAECGYGLAYRVLDAQFVRVDGHDRAVPQRRRRVFVVGHLGDWRRAAAVLFERQSMRGDPPPRREAGQNAAPTLSARTQGGGGLGTDFDLDGGLIANAIAATLTRGADSAGKGGYAGRRQEDDINIVASTGGVSHCLNAGSMGRMDYETETLVAHSLRGGGFDASEDGTGRGVPLVPVGVALRGRDGGATADLTGDVITSLRTGVGGGDKAHVLLPFDETQVTSATNRSRPMAGDPCHPLAAGARPPAIAFNARQDPDVFHGHSGPLDTDGSTQALCVADGVAAAGCPQGSRGDQQAWRVRRLMPIECERLQGFPDGYTAIPVRGKAAADGPRYKALGNSMAVNVMRWIGRRIEMVERIAPASGQLRAAMSDAAPNTPRKPSAE